MLGIERYPLSAGLDSGSGSGSGSSYLETTNVEPVPLGTLQFSTLVEVRVLVFSWSVGWYIVTFLGKRL